MGQPSAHGQGASASAHEYNDSQASLRGQPHISSSDQWINLDVARYMSDAPDILPSEGQNIVNRMDRYSYSTAGRSSMPSLHSPFSDNSQTRLIPSPLGVLQNEHESPVSSSPSNQRVEVSSIPTPAVTDNGPPVARNYVSHLQGEKSDGAGAERVMDRNVVRLSGDLLCKPELTCDQVTWKGDDDIENPKNWPNPKKWRVTLLVSLASFLAMFTSAMVAPAGTTIASEFEIGATTTIVIVSIFVLGFAVGPFYIAPMSEVYGRMAVLQASMSFFLIFNVACCIAQNEAQLIAFRFLSGIGGSAALVLGGGILTSDWPPDWIIVIANSSQRYLVTGDNGQSQRNLSPRSAGWTANGTTCVCFHRQCHVMEMDLWRRFHCLRIFPSNGAVLSARNLWTHDPQEKDAAAEAEEWQSEPRAGG